MLLPEIADRPKVRALGAHDGEEGQIAFAGQGELAARKYPHAVRIQQQADHHRRVKRGRASGFVLIGRIETAQVQPRYRIEQEEGQIALRQLGVRAMGLLPVALGLPRTIRFPVLVAHQPSPYSDRLEDTQSKKSDHSLLSQPRQPPDNKLVKCFFIDRLLEHLHAYLDSCPLLVICHSGISGEAALFYSIYPS